MSKNKENKTDSVSQGFLTKTDAFFNQRLDALFYLSLFGLLLYSLMLFEANISIGGDDSFYIMRAVKFNQDGIFPSFQGPLYPLILSPFIALFGLKVHLLKTLSIVFTAVFFFFFYRAYRHRVNATVLVASLFILALNSFVLHFASQTYNEAFHLMIQLIFFYQFFRVYELTKEKDADIRGQYKEWLLLGFTLFLMAISKNLGLVGVLTVSGFFVLHARWKALLASLLSWGLFMGLFSAIKNLFFDAGTQISKQGLMLLYKDPYNFSKGKEDLAGFVDRFLENSSIYLSKNMMKIFQLRDDAVTEKIELLTILFGVIILLGLFISFRKNKYMFFTGAYLAITLVSIFFILQTRWDANRLVFLVVPFFCIFVLYVADDLVRRSKFKILQPVFFVLLLGYFFFGEARGTTQKIDLLTLKKNLSGDKYLGYTPDWQNFLMMSEWAGKNLPEGSFVASRKGAMSSIYADGKKFYNLSRVFSQDPDTLLDKLQEHNVTHVILAKLRRNPKQKSDYTINTVHRYLSIIESTYPGTFRFVHQVGQTDNEEARLFEINYNAREIRKNQP